MVELAQGGVAVHAKARARQIALKETSRGSPHGDTCGIAASSNYEGEIIYQRAKGRRNGVTPCAEPGILLERFPELAPAFPNPAFQRQVYKCEDA